MNLIGQQFGDLSVRELYGINKWGHVLWLCECKCGKTAQRTTSVLRRKESTSCGCKRRIQPICEMVGKKFGRLEVKEFSRRDNSGKLYWECTCECGKEKEVNGAHLRYGNTKSCGCLHTESVSKSNLERKSEPRAKRMYRKEIDRGYYRVNSKPHEQALAAAGISFA